MAVVLERVDGLMPIGCKNIACATSKALIYLKCKILLAPQHDAELEGKEAYVCPRSRV
jgi:hypothetical protein